MVIPYRASCVFSGFRDGFRRVPISFKFVTTLLFMRLATTNPSLSHNLATGSGWVPNGFRQVPHAIVMIPYKASSYFSGFRDGCDFFRKRSAELWRCASVGPAFLPAEVARGYYFRPGLQPITVQVTSVDDWPVMYRTQLARNSLAPIPRVWKCIAK